MKHYILPALLWVLATSQILAQKTLAPGAQSQAGNWSRSVKKMMCNAGYDLNAPTVPSVVQSRANPLRLDSTKTFLGYETNAAGDSTPQFRTTYQYLATGQKISTEFVFEDNAWLPVTQTNESFDALGRSVFAFTKTYDSPNQSWVSDNRVRLWPRGNSMDLLDSFQVETWDLLSEVWVLSFQSKNTFDPQNRLQKSETLLDLDGQTVLMMDNYYYNASGDNHLVESFIGAGGFFLPTTKREMTYTNHLLIETIISNGDGIGGLLPSNRITMAYNSQDLVKQVAHYNWMADVNTWVLTQVTKQEYDSQLRLSATETENIFVGEPSDFERITYSYVADENLARVATYVWDTALNRYVLVGREYYYYSGGSSSVQPSPRAARTLSLSPNPTDGEVRFPMEAAAEVWVFDVAGQMLQSRILQPGEALNLHALPNGVYQVTARSGADFYVGKVVKD